MSSNSANNNGPTPFPPLCLSRPLYLSRSLTLTPVKDVDEDKFYDYCDYYDTSSRMITHIVRAQRKMLSKN